MKEWWWWGAVSKKRLMGEKAKSNSHGLVFFVLLNLPSKALMGLFWAWLLLSGNPTKTFREASCVRKEIWTGYLV